MQEFFQDIEKLRDLISTIEKDIGHVKQVQDNILTSPRIEQRTKHQLEDVMEKIKSNSISGKFMTVKYARHEDNTKIPDRLSG